MTIETQAAHSLLGTTLPKGWLVTQKIEKPIGHSGGNFSVSYIVERDNERAFLKALNFDAFFQNSEGTNLVDLIQYVTKAFQYERDLLQLCKDSNLTKVIVIYDSGELTLQGNFFQPRVPYLIFELADGDVRKKMEFSRKLDIAWKLNSIHDVAVGLKQLHSINVAHQDLKPSNIFTYENNITKIGDLGRSICDTLEGPHSKLQFAGDKTYAPPEILYGYFLEDKRKKDFSIDCYLLGSLICFYFLGVNMTTLIKGHLNDDFHWDKWVGSFEEVEPYLVNAFGKALDALENSIMDEYLKKEIRTLLEFLCNMNPNKRGHPKTIGSTNPNQYNLERIVSILAKLNLKAQYHLIKN